MHSTRNVATQKTQEQHEERNQYEKEPKQEPGEVGFHEEQEAVVPSGNRPFFIELPLRFHAGLFVTRRVDDRDSLRFRSRSRDQRHWDVIALISHE